MNNFCLSPLLSLFVPIKIVDDLYYEYIWMEKPCLTNLNMCKYVQVKSHKPSISGIRTILGKYALKTIHES